LPRSDADYQLRGRGELVKKRSPVEGKKQKGVVFFSLR
jgi:hypothetical protein